MKCVECNQDIPSERLAILPDTKTCVACSQVRPLIGITVWDKTTPTLLTVDQNDAEFLWRMEKVDGRLTRLK